MLVRGRLVSGLVGHTLEDTSESIYLSRQSEQLRMSHDVEAQTTVDIGAETDAKDHDFLAGES